MKLCILIPSFNEQQTIGWLVNAVRKDGYDVIVVDDGSQDETAKIARENGAEVIINEHNLGKGASLRKAFGILTGRDYEAVIIMDGDGQHLPSDLVKFIIRYQEKKPGMIIGNRMFKAKGMPLIRWLTNRFMSFVISGMCRQHIPDTQCGFRLVDTGVLKKMNLRTENFEIESEMLLEAARNGYAIESVPIATIYEGQASAIHPVKDTLRFFRFIFKKR